MKKFTAIYRWIGNNPPPFDETLKHGTFTFYAETQEAAQATHGIMKSGLTFS